MAGCCIEVLGTGEPLKEIEKCGDNIYVLVFAPVKDSDFINVYGMNITDMKEFELQ